MGIKARFDLAPHQKTVRTAWRKLTAAAELKRLSPHYLHRQCLTEIAENDVRPSS
jgi:hypothetical protein